MATQDLRVTAQSSDRTWSTGGGSGKPLQYTSYENSMNWIKRQKDMIPKHEPLRSEGVQYATGEEWQTPLKLQKEWSSRVKVEMMLSYGCVQNLWNIPEQYESKIWRCKEQYCIGTLSIRSMNQGKLDVVK